MLLDYTQNCMLAQEIRLGLLDCLGVRSGHEMMMRADQKIHIATTILGGGVDPRPITMHKRITPYSQEDQRPTVCNCGP